MPSFFGVDDVHELHEDLANTWWSIATSNVRTGDHHFFNGSIFLAFFSHVPFEVLHEFLVKKVFGVAHVK